jgi:hypothetical protein
MVLKKNLYINCKKIKKTKRPKALLWRVGRPIQKQNDPKPSFGG